MFAPPPAPSSSRNAPNDPCLVSFSEGAAGVDPLATPDPIMAAMGLFFASREARREAELAELQAEARQRLGQRQSA